MWITNAIGKLLNPAIGGSGVRQSMRDLWAIYGNPTTPTPVASAIGAGAVADDGTVALVTIDAKEIYAPVATIDGVTPISTTTPIGTTTYTSKTFYTQGFSVICGTCFSNASGTVYIDQSADGVNWDFSTAVAITGNTGASLGNVSVVAPYARVRFTPSTSNTVLRLFPFLRRI